MVFLDQKGIKQANTVIMATAAADCVFLGDPEARYGFPRIEQAHVGPLDRFGIAAGQCGRAREQLQKIEGSTFTGEDRAGMAINGKEQVVLNEAITVLFVPGHLEFGVNDAKNRIDKLRTTQDARLPGNNPCPGFTVGFYKARSDVAAAYIFTEC